MLTCKARHLLGTNVFEVRKCAVYYDIAATTPRLDLIQNFLPVCSQSAVLNVIH